MRLFEKEILLSDRKKNKSDLFYLKKDLTEKLEKDSLFPIRVAVTSSNENLLKCEVGVVEKSEDFCKTKDSLFDFERRKFENTGKFNVVFLVPTGIGAEIGGHAGDATPVAKLLSSVCDNLITHPNVFNGSDINEMTENSLYVEGSIICRLLMGTAGLQPVRANRVLAVIGQNEHSIFESSAVNSVNAARATLGLDCPKILKSSSLTKMSSFYSSSERAVGVVENINSLFSLLEKETKNFDAIAISSVIKVPKNYHIDYFKSWGKMINPWGGVEAMLTHALSYKFNVPSAHAPMFESPEIANMDTGIVDVRAASEAVSTTFFHSVLKGLHKSPKVITDRKVFNSHDILSAKDISCLVIPDGCLGLPTLAALEQGIKVIAVKENQTLMKNNLEKLSWRKGQFFQAENYLEAVGLLNSIKTGINVTSVRRPFKTLKLFNSEKQIKIDKDNKGEEVRASPYFTRPLF